MADKLKVADSILIDHANLGLVAGLPFGIIGPVDLATGNWDYLDQQVSILIQNLSGDDITLATDPAVVVGVVLEDNVGIIFNLGTGCRDTIYAVAAGAAAASVIVAISVLSAT